MQWMVTQRNEIGPRRLPRMGSSRDMPAMRCRDAAHTASYRSRTDAIVSSSVSTNESSALLANPKSARGRNVIPSSNHASSTNVACLTRPRSVVSDGTRERRACSSVSPSSEPRSSSR